MKRSITRIASIALTALACIGSGFTPAFADDSEVFTSAAYTSGNAVRPNILFVIDTSGSMSSNVMNYDPSMTYAGPCPVGRVYWRTTNSAQPPDCTTTNSWVLEARNTCAASANGMTNLGWWRGVTQQFNPGTNQWGNARNGASNDPMECGADSGIHGETAVSASRWARNNAARWTNNAGQSINWGGRQTLSLYSANYANWWYGAGTGTLQTRWEIVRDVAKALIDNLDGVNLGLMRYSTTAQGGMVVHPVGELTPASRTTMKALLDGYGPNGWTPLSETYFEAAQYFRGAAVDFGNASAPGLSVAGSRVGNTLAGTNYNSPMDFSCQNNYIVYLTDGLPTEDASADAKIAALPNFATAGGACNATNPDPAWPTSGRCMVALANYLHSSDLQSSLVGTQNVKTYMIGFGSDIAPAKDYLDAIAAAGGTGESYTSDSVGGLANQLEEIFTNILEGNDVTFTSPTLSVNAFNRTRNLNDLYVSVFSPSRGLHWPGNLKKYQIENGAIVDAAGNPAVDPTTGFFTDTARSFWSEDGAGNPITDGAEVTLGGAASQLPSYVESMDGRNLYTYLGNPSLSDASNQIKDSNSTLTNTILDIGGADDPSKPNLIAFVRGQDLTDTDGDTNTDERRMRMGDPMHARPALVIYGGTAADPDGLVFVPTNDGYLHALDSDTGEEKWAFIPPEFLPRLKRLYEDAVTPNREYAIDGDVTVFKFDVNGNGIVETGDKVYLFFGFGRGGNAYYALDVTDKDAPELLWRKDASSLPGLAKAWSTPTIARVDINGASQNAEKLVLVFGGGYDEAQENYVYTADSIGSRVFMVDLEDGDLLWWAGNSGSANLNLAQMNNSIPSKVTVIDIDGNKFADRMYVGDMGGRVWRFDIWNGQAVSSLVTGGVIARLGAGNVAGAPRSAARRFYNAPDVAIIQRRGSPPFFNVALGSGYRGHPLEQDTQDRFYALRDYLPFTKRTQLQYAALTPILDGDLVDITTPVAVPDGSPGWKLPLNDGGSWIGEKVLAESVTVAGVILFPTFIPLGEDPANPCTARTVNRAYAIRVENGGAYFDTRYIELQQSGIAAEISLLVNSQIDGDVLDPNGDEDGDGITNSTDDDIDGDGIPNDEEDDDDDEDEDEGNTCLSGVEVMSRCVDFDETVRSFWQRQ